MGWFMNQNKNLEAGSYISYIDCRSAIFWGLWAFLTYFCIIDYFYNDVETGVETVSRLSSNNSSQNNSRRFISWRFTNHNHKPWTICHMLEKYEYEVFYSKQN